MAPPLRPGPSLTPYFRGPCLGQPKPVMGRTALLSPQSPEEYCCLSSIGELVVFQNCCSSEEKLRFILFIVVIVDVVVLFTPIIFKKRVIRLVYTILSFVRCCC